MGDQFCPLENLVKMNFNDIYNGKRVLITGHTGFKGSWLTSWLLKMNAIVCGISDKIPTQPSIFEALNLDKKIDHYFGDIRKIEDLRPLINKHKPDFIFHLAAQPLVSISYQDPLETISTNVFVTSTLLEVIREIEHHCAVVIITSDKCYQNNEWVWGYREIDSMGGNDIYSASKGAAELIFKAYYESFYNKPNAAVKLATGRAGNVIGGGDWSKDRIIVDCILSWTNSKPVEIRSPKSTRPWQHVLEPLSGYLTLAAALYENKDVNGESFNFGPESEQNRTVLELIEDLSYQWGFNNLNDAYFIAQNSSYKEAELLKLNCDKAQSYLKWHSNLKYSECVKLLSEWYKKYYSNSDIDMFDFTMKQISLYEEKAKERSLPWIK